MDGEDDELAALRARSARYQQHVRQYGNRADIRRLREQRDEEAEFREREEGAASRHEPSPIDRPAQDDDDDDELFGPLPPPPSRSQETAEDDKELSLEVGGAFHRLRDLVPVSFGRQTKAPLGGGSGHLKRKRPGASAAPIAVPLRQPTPGPGAGVPAGEAPPDPLPPPLTSPASSPAGATGERQPAEPREVRPSSAARESGSDSDSDSDSDEELDNPYELPISHEATLEGHERVASALSVDPPGARLVSGGYDYFWKLYAFAGMNSAMRSFRSKEPDEGHQVRHLRFDRRGNRFLCVTGSAQAKVFDREGFELAQTVRGDMYLHDMRFTSGHVSSITDGHWSPTDEDVFVTSGQDGTVRFWGAQQPKKNLHVAVFKNRKGLRQTVSAIGLSHNGSMVAAAGTDGSLQVFPVSKGTPAARPGHRVNEAHLGETETSSLCWSRDNLTLLSRGGDHTLKLWDIRKFQVPVKVVTGLRNDFAQTDVIFSPNEQLVVTPTSAERSLKPQATAAAAGGSEDIQGGRLCFFERRTLRPVEAVKLGATGGIRVVWNARINQIFVSLQDGKIRSLYDPKLSTNGALLCATRQPRASDPAEELEFLDVITPHSLQQFRPEPSERKRRRLARQDPQLSHMPLPPIEGQVGRGGRVQNLKLNQYFMQKVLEQETAALPPILDPREALLKYANVAKEDPIFTAVYQETQPKPIYAQLTEAELEEEERNALAANTRYGGVAQLKEQLAQELEAEKKKKR